MGESSAPNVLKTACNTFLCSLVINIGRGREALVLSYVSAIVR